MQGDREVHNTFSLLVLPPKGEYSSHFSPAPVCGPSHRLQFFTNCSCAGPLQGLKSCQQTCSSVGSYFHRPTGLARSIHPFWCGVLQRAKVDICYTMDHYGHTCLTMVLSTGCQGISPLAPGAPLPSFFNWPWCLESCFSHILSHTLSGCNCCCSFSFPF